MGRRRASGGSGNRELDFMIEEIVQMLQHAVRVTLETNSPEPARSEIARVIAIDDEIGDVDEPPPGQMITLLVLARWLATTAQELDQPVADEVLDWIADNIGARYRARARYVIGVLDPADAAEALQQYADALAEDFLPTLIWIATALVALHGDRDPGWLTPVSARRR